MKDFSFLYMYLVVKYCVCACIFHVVHMSTHVCADMYTTYYTTFTYATIEVIVFHISYENIIVNNYI